MFQRLNIRFPIKNWIVMSKSGKNFQEQLIIYFLETRIPEMPHDIFLKLLYSFAFDGNTFLLDLAPNFLRGNLETFQQHGNLRFQRTKVSYFGNSVPKIIHYTRGLQTSYLLCTPFSNPYIYKSSPQTFLLIS